MRLTPFQFLTQLEQIAQFVKPKSSKAQIRDEKDRMFLEIAATRPAVDFVITGDKDFEHDRYESVAVISASLFVETVLCE